MVFLDEAEHFLHNRNASVATLRALFAFGPECRSRSLRNQCSPSPESAACIRCDTLNRWSSDTVCQHRITDLLVRENNGETGGAAEEQPKNDVGLQYLTPAFMSGSLLFLVLGTYEAHN